MYYSARGICRPLERACERVTRNCARSDTLPEISVPTGGGRYCKTNSTYRTASCGSSTGTPRPHWSPVKQATVAPRAPGSRRATRQPRRWSIRLCAASSARHRRQRDRCRRAATGDDHTLVRSGYRFRPTAAAHPRTRPDGTPRGASCLRGGIKRPGCRTPAGRSATPQHREHAERRLTWLAKTGSGRELSQPVDQVKSRVADNRPREL